MILWDCVKIYKWQALLTCILLACRIGAISETLFFALSPLMFMESFIALVGQLNWSFMRSCRRLYWLSWSTVCFGPRLNLPLLTAQTRACKLKIFICLLIASPLISFTLIHFYSPSPSSNDFLLMNTVFLMSNRDIIIFN